VKGLTWAIVALILVGAGIGVYFILQKPREIVTMSPGSSADSIAVYEQRITELKQRLEATKTTLGRIQLLDRPAVRLRIAHMENHLKELHEALANWREAHDELGVGEAYRECLLLYGGASAACHALSFDTLPLEPDSVQPPGN
jgi:hypothetical protein